METRNLSDEIYDVWCSIYLVNRLWQSGIDDGIQTVEGSQMLSRAIMRLYRRWIHLLMQLNADIYSPIKGEQP